MHGAKLSTARDRDPAWNFRQERLPTSETESDDGRATQRTPPSPTWAIPRHDRAPPCLRDACSSCSFSSPVAAPIRAPISATISSPAISTPIRWIPTAAFAFRRASTSREHLRAGRSVPWCRRRCRCRRTCRHPRRPGRSPCPHFPRHRRRHYADFCSRLVRQQSAAATPLPRTRCVGALTKRTTETALRQRSANERAANETNLA